MEYRKLITWVWITLAIVSLSPVLSGEEAVDISPSSISITASPGDFAEAWLSIRNNLNRNIDIRVEGLDGKILDAIPSVDKTRINIPPNEEKYIKIMGYIPKTSKEGAYTGGVILNIDKSERRIPITVEVLIPVENVSLELKIHPVKSEIAPGHTLYIQSDITNLGSKTVKAEIELRFIDPDTGRIILGKGNNITVESVVSIIAELNIPGNTEQKDYRIEGILYYISSDGEKRIITSAESSVTVKRTISDMLSKILAEFTLARIQLIVFIFIAFVLLYLHYIHYRREAIRRKRYLESIKFDTLPQPGPKSGFIGKIAETNIMAFLDLNSLQTHTLIAGATGCGKTIVAQIIAEEALLKGKSVIVFDPSARWSGFLRANKDSKMIKLYGKFHMKKENAMPFRGNVYVVTDSSKRIEIERFIKPGEITIFYLKDMDIMEMEIFISNTIDKIIQLNPKESQELKTLLIFDEVHRILPKFGGSGKGILYIEKATREFRKWGIGVVLISQVLKDFTSVIQANIGTEVQMQTRYEEDLNQIKTKYGEDIHRSVVRINVGSGMIQNSEYNGGAPYFVSFRPLLHSPNKLGDEELQLYEKYNLQIDELVRKFNEVKNAGVDVFDIELELNLAQDSITGGAFGIVDLYTTSLGRRIDEYYSRIQNKQISAEEIAILSEWDTRKKEEIKSYENELRILIEKEKRKLEEKERLAKEREDAERKRLGDERKRLGDEEKKRREEIEKRQVTLKSESKVLDLLKEHEKEVVIREDIRVREEEKLRIKEGELRRRREDEEGRIEEEKRKKLEEEKKIVDEAEKKEEFLKGEMQRVDERWEEITADKRMILERDREIAKKENELAEDIKAGIREEIERKKRIKDELTSEKTRTRQEELKKEELELSRILEEKRSKRGSESKDKRREFKDEKEKLQSELQTIKERWKGILENERQIREKKEELEQTMGELDIRINEERKRMEAGIEVKGDWGDFELMEKEWERMDQLDAERKKLEEELNDIRKELKIQKGLRSEEEKEFKGKKEELKRLGEEAGIPGEIYEELKEEKIEAEVVKKISPEEKQKLKEKEEELIQKLGEWDSKIEEEEKRVGKIETGKGEWEDFELMEKEWGRMDSLREEKKKIKEELDEIRKKLQRS